ncbi:MAG: ATP-binding cassette domain-containing protein, partial [Myxococcota bacterium]|nr:ATP-binding cassette domain-containing protein [Myxococcota bacterium]
MAQPPIIAFDGLSVTVPDARTGAPRRLLDDVSFEILPGQLVGLIGPSGSGKSTLVRVLCGILGEKEGTVTFRGEPLRPEHQRQIGYAPQVDHLHGRLTVEESCRFATQLRYPDFSDQEVGRRVNETLSGVRMASLRQSRISAESGGHEVGGLSGGQRKRASVAIELVSDLEVLVLDEPLTGLSAPDARMVMGVLSELRSSGTTILIVAHEISTSFFSLLDKVVLMEPGGQVSFTGTPSELFDYGEELLGGMEGARELEPDLEEMSRPERFWTIFSHARMQVSGQAAPVSGQRKAHAIMELREVFAWAKQTAGWLLDQGLSIAHSLSTVRIDSAA